MLSVGLAIHTLPLTSRTWPAMPLNKVLGVLIFKYPVPSTSSRTSSGSLLPYSTILKVAVWAARRLQLRCGAVKVEASSEAGIGMAGVTVVDFDTGSMGVCNSCSEAMRRSRSEGRSARSESRLVMVKRLSQKLQNWNRKSDKPYRYGECDKREECKQKQAMTGKSRNSFLTASVRLCWMTARSFWWRVKRMI